MSDKKLELSPSSIFFRFLTFKIAAVTRKPRLMMVVKATGKTKKHHRAFCPVMKPICGRGGGRVGEGGGGRGGGRGGRGGREEGKGGGGGKGGGRREGGGGVGGRGGRGGGRGEGKGGGGGKGGGRREGGRKGEKR